MAKGKQIEPEMVYQIVAAWSVSGNYSEVARQFDMPASTVRKLVIDNKDKPEFVKLCDENKVAFADKATSIIDKGMSLLERRLNRALEQEESLDVLIDEIYATGKEELSQDEKNRLISKVKALQLQDIKAVTTAIGTLFDKRALARGESTNQTKVEIVLPKEAEDYAG